MKTRATISIGLMLILSLAAVGAVVPTTADDACDVTVTEGQSIQAALDAADPDDTVCVGPGTYVEALEIQTAGLTLRSTDGPEDTILDPAGAFVGIRVFGNLGDITVDGFTVTEDWVAGGIGQGLGAREGTVFHVHNNVVMAPATTTQHGNAIQVTGDGSTVIGNTVAVPHQTSSDWSGSGILVFSANNTLIQDNTVTSGPSDYCIAIGGDNFGFPAAHDNVVEGNVVHDCGTGILIHGGVHGTFVQDNEVRDSTRGLLSHALTASNPSGTTVLGNLFEGNTVQVEDLWEAGEPDDAPDLDLVDVFTLNTFDRSAAAYDFNAQEFRVFKIFSTISDAVDAAEPGDAVPVGSGLYTENVVIDKTLLMFGVDGRENTVIQGSTGSGLGTVVFTGDTDGSHLEGFTIIGYEAPSPGLENAAVYLQGAHSDLTITLNEIRADGESALLSEWGRALSDIVVTQNVFSGKTFVGDEPAGQGTSQQFTLPNVPRQLVALGHGGSAQGIVFADNQITGTTGGLNDEGLPQGNTVVTMDASDSTISGNTFEAETMWFSNVLRARGTDVDISDNTFASNGLGDRVNHVFLGAATADVEDVVAANEFDKGAFVPGGNQVTVAIQRSVDMAPGAGSVLVLAGTYEEDVVVGKDLTLAAYSEDAPELVGSIHATSPESFTLEGIQVNATADGPLKGIALATTDVPQVRLLQSTFVADGPVSALNPGSFGGIVDLHGVIELNATGVQVEGTQEGPGGSSALRVVYAGEEDVSVLVQDAQLFGHKGNGLTLAGKNPAAEVTVLGSSFSGNGYGLLVNGANYTLLEVRDNVVENNTESGLRFLGQEGETLLRNNQISGNGLGLGVGDGGDRVDARFNYWGSPAGPLVNDQANVFLIDYTPWCLDADCSSTQSVEGLVEELL